MGQGNDTDFSARRALRPLSVIVIGAGIEILEKRDELAEVGAGIQLAPNASRILGRFGLLDEVMRYSTVLERTISRRWDNDEELDCAHLVPDIEAKFGMPVVAIHRADIQNVLSVAVVGCGCKILRNHQVVDVDPQFLPYVYSLLSPLDYDTQPLLMSCFERILVRNNGTDTWMSADLIVAADGMKSVIRSRMADANGHADSLDLTGESAYRFLLPVNSAQHDETVMALIEKNHALRYMGPGGHIVAYPLRQNKLYNVVLVHAIDREILAQSARTAYGKKEEMIKYYQGWSPIIQALMKYAPDSEVLETPMSKMSPLPTWVKGRVALAGDACHHMLPYLAQGAANAIEDAGTLAMAFTCTDNIEVALEVYQRVRKTRSELTQSSSANTGHMLHLPDGEEQRTRDETIRAASRGDGDNPDQFNDRRTREFIWGVDVMAETIKQFESSA
ncbi:putative salicylate hydroxylase [Xylaria nigripes]|nr:putative salicylate hydroxylase [Xylaria nigripes]